MVSVKVPVGLPRGAVTVKVEVLVPPPDSNTGFGLNVPETLPGRPLTLRLTLPEKLFRDVSVTV